jgi:hypothetical protein
MALKQKDIPGILFHARKDDIFHTRFQKDADFLPAFSGWQNKSSITYILEFNPKKLPGSDLAEV